MFCLAFFDGWAGLIDAGETWGWDWYTPDSDTKWVGQVLKFLGTMLVSVTSMQTVHHFTNYRTADDAKAGLRTSLRSKATGHFYTLVLFGAMLVKVLKDLNVPGTPANEYKWLSYVADALHVGTLAVSNVYFSRIASATLAKTDDASTSIWGQPLSVITFGFLAFAFYFTKEGVAWGQVESCDADTYTENLDVFLDTFKYMALAYGTYVTHMVNTIIAYTSSGGKKIKITVNSGLFYELSTGKSVTSKDGIEILERRHLNFKTTQRGSTVVISSV